MPPGRQTIPGCLAIVKTLFCTLYDSRASNASNAAQHWIKHPRYSNVILVRKARCQGCVTRYSLLQREETLSYRANTWRLPTSECTQNLTSGAKCARCTSYTTPLISKCFHRPKPAVLATPTSTRIKKSLLTKFWSSNLSKAACCDGAGTPAGGQWICKSDKSPSSVLVTYRRACAVSSIRDHPPGIEQ